MSVVIWIAVIIAAVLLAVGRLFASPWWDKAVAVFAAIVLMAAAGAGGCGAAINPMDIMAAKKFPNTAGWFRVGETDGDYMRQQQVYQAAEAAGMDVQYWVSPGTGHDWGTAVADLAHVLPWLGMRLGLTA